MDLNSVRKENFLRLLREQFGNSPKKFEAATGYSANMVSQFRGGSKNVSDKIARKIETSMKLPVGALDIPSAAFVREPRRQSTSWPLSVSQSDFESLSPKAQREIDDAFTRMVLGAQAQEMLNRQKRQSKG